eukprot:GGOE01001438.1.p1 GENE.GGOE01001438.1~~GGOE01001438.1.p1  ORF type:complete len:377 (-),score=118.05 GGOE01001438.1:152-1282(-)
MMRRTARRLLQRLAFYDQTVEKYASQEAHHLTVGNVMEQASRGRKGMVANAQYVHQQLPIRLANTIRKLQTLPFIVGVNPHVNTVYHMYWDAFQVVRKFPAITNHRQADDFTDLLLYLLEKNKSQLVVLAKGIAEVRTKRVKRVDSAYLDSFLDQFLTEALTRRTLVSIQVTQEQAGAPGTKGDWVAIFRRDCLPFQSVHYVMQEVQSLCQNDFGFAPPYEVGGDTGATFLYIPSHLEFILFELLKNAAYAVCRRQLREPSKQLRPIEVTLRKGDYLEVLISDQGGGLRVQKKERIWSYGYTGEPHEEGETPVVVDAMSASGLPQAARLKGSGFGLPTARVYLRYLGGDILLHSTLGYGCHCHLKFAPVLGSCLLT